MSEDNGRAIAVINPDQTRELIPVGYEPIQLSPARRLPNEDEYAMMLKIASNAVQAGAGVTDKNARALPANIKTAEQAMVIMLAGFELGMTPNTALRRLFIVNGRVELETQALMGLVRAFDPSAKFRFVKYERDECRVQLWRDELIFGEDGVGKRVSVMQIEASYTKEDAITSGQLTEQWWRRRDPNGAAPGTPFNRLPYVEVGPEWKPKGHNERRGRAVQGKQNAWYVEELQDSVWTKYQRDMMAYSACKRACRLGAPDATNMIIAESHRLLESPQAMLAGAVPAHLLPAPSLDPDPAVDEISRNAGDEDEALVNPISAGVISGEINPEEALREEGEPAPVGDDDDEDGDQGDPLAPDPEEDEGGSLNPTSDEAQKQEPIEASATEDLEQPPDGESVAKLTRLMLDTKSSGAVTPAAYRGIFIEFARKYTPELEGDKFNPANVKTEREVHEIMAALRQLRGEGDAP